MRCVTVPQVAHTLQDALDRWSEVAAGLAEISDAMNLGGLDAEAQAFDPARCHSPLPRAYQWADGSAYVNHVALVRQARGAERSEEHTSELQSLMRISYAVFCLKKKKKDQNQDHTTKT